MADLGSVHDRELLLKVAANDEQAFRQLFDNYHQQLGAHMLQITRSMELAEEVVQDVFLKIWMSREVLTEVRDFRAYLFVVSKNHALNCLRRLAKERVLKKEWESDQRVRRLTADTEQSAGYYSLIDKAIDQLPPQQQKVYLLSRHQRLKYSEIAIQLNLSRETVKKYLQFAIASIRSYIRKSLIIIYFIMALWIYY